MSSLLSIGRIIDVGVGDPPPPPEGETFAERVAELQSQGVTVYRWGRSVDTSGTTYTMEVGANGTIHNPVPGDYDLGEILVNSDGGSSMGLSGASPDPTRITIATVEQAAIEVTAFCQFDQAQTGTRNVYWVNNGPDAAGACACRVQNDGAGGLRHEMRIADSNGALVVKAGTTLAQVPIREPVMLSYVIANSDLKAYTNAVEAPLGLTTGALSAWTAPAAGSTQIGANLFNGASSNGIEGVLGEFLVTSPLTATQREYLAEHARQTIVAALDFASGVDENAGPTNFPTVTATHPAGATISIQAQPSIGSATGGTDVIIYTPPASVAADTAAPMTYRTTFGGQTADATFTPTVRNSIAQGSTLPEDDALAASVGTPLNANTGNISTQYAALAAGQHLILANGNYGSFTFNRSFAANNRAVIRAQNLHGAIFNSLTISGSGQIVSGVDVNPGASVTDGTRVNVAGSNVRVTRSMIRNGARGVNVGEAVTDVLIDHCEIHRTSDRMFMLADPKDQQRITIARCWIHEMVGGGSLGTSHGFAWAEENFYREKHHDIVARLNYVGPGEAGSETNSDFIHHKGSGSIYAFNRFEGAVLLTHRFGLRTRAIGNYAPGANARFWDDLGWIYGNSYNEIQCPGGRSCYYDDTKNLASAPENSVGGFHAHKRSRISGNTGLIELGFLYTTADWCTGTPGTAPETLPDPCACGMIKPARSFEGVNYAADNPNDPDVGVKIRAHSGSISPNTTPCVNLPGGWVQNLSSQPSNAAPDTWRDELFAQYPWIEEICPNPTSQTGGPGNSAPWSVAQGLNRGDHATSPSVGPNRNSPGGLP